MLTTLGDCANADARSIGGQNSFPGSEFCQSLKETLFQRQVFWNRFNHEIRIDDLRIEVRGAAQTLQRRCQLSRTQQALLLQRAQESLGLEKPFASAF